MCKYSDARILILFVIVIRVSVFRCWYFRSCKYDVFRFCNYIYISCK